MCKRLYSYVVRYDSGFAPNPFYRYCTLATCKPDIRRHARIGDWVVGTGSGDKRIKRAGYLVYAMEVSETLPFEEYWDDERFQLKKPNLRQSKMRAAGDNIYRRREDGRWDQLDSFHSQKDSSPNPKHIATDTGVNRVLVGSRFVYFGGEGPPLPEQFLDYQGESICKRGRGVKVIKNGTLIEQFIDWLDALGQRNYSGHPHDWISRK